jgi:hypothetical protein
MQITRGAADRDLLSKDVKPTLVAFTQERT